MKAIILAAWKGTRLRPLTNTIPKPLIKIFWKSILEHNLEIIYDQVDEIIIVVNYLKEKIIESIWDSYKWTKIIYHIQWEEKWTGAAIKWLDINDDIILLNWDSIFEKKDIEKVIKLEWYWCLVKEVENPEKYWIFKQSDKWFAEEIIEKPENNIWNLANLGFYKFSKDILSLSKNIKLSKRSEYEITDAINNFCKLFPFQLINIEWNFIDIWVCPDILKANNYFLGKLEKSEIIWIVEDWVTIKWNILLSKWSIIKSWTYIEWNVFIWKNSIIWPNSYIRWWTVIWNNCKVWNAVELKNTTLWDYTKVSHLSYLWDSILWNNINIAWWFISANVRHDKSEIKILVKWKIVSTYMTKFWVIIWDNVSTWVNTCTMPWRTLENDSFTSPWEIIK